MLTVIFYFNKVSVLILWVFVMTYIYFYQIDTTFNLTVKMGHSVVYYFVVKMVLNVSIKAFWHTNRRLLEKGVDL